MRDKRTEKGYEPSEKVYLQARANGLAARGQAPYPGSSQGPERRDPADTPITSGRREKGKEPIQEDGEASSLPSPPATVLVADDHPLFRGALKGLLGHEPGLEVVGEAGDGEEALELCRSLRPDLVLMDVRMPEMNGLEATRAIKREFPRTVVLILTAFDEPGFLLKALGAGADGYVLKYLTHKQLINVVRRVLSGETPLNQELAAELIVSLDGEAKHERGSPQQSERREEEPPPELLTERELEVLRLLARGRHNPEIARDLEISPGTVKIHVHHIISKLGASDRTQAVVRAIDLGLLTPKSG